MKNNFLRLIFGIKNILLIILLYYLLFIPKVFADNCLSFLPYGFNNFYVQLPENASFCVKQKTTNKYKTDNYGGRLLINENFKNKIQIFGDSQVIGLEMEKIEHHYLYSKYKNSNFIIYAAPNNGPYEVINFLNKNKNILNKKIIITFNFAVDAYRVRSGWDPNNYVALKDYELDSILEHPLKYRWIIFKNLISRKNFTLSRHNNAEMQNLFLNLNINKVNKNIINYFNKLNKTADILDLEIDFIITHPYWVYSVDKDNKKLLLNKGLAKKVERLICNSFQSTKRISKILISELPDIRNLTDLTVDKRHFKLDKIKLQKYGKICIN